MFKNQPKGLFSLALANTGERFGYYTMLAIFALFMQAKFGWSEAVAGQVYAIFLAAIYFMPMVGGTIADKIGYGKCVTLGVVVMFLGYLCLFIPTDADMVGKIVMFTGLAFVAVGTGLFKGNLQVLVGNLYDDPKYAAKRDNAFGLFYMAINLGAMFAPMMAREITNWSLKGAGFKYNAADISSEYLDALSDAYGMCFGVACVSLIFSMIIYFATRAWWKHADMNVHQKKALKKDEPAEELTPEQTKSRVTALFLVFAVVIFFWMAFHQNGSALTFFAKKYTDLTVTGPMRICFNIWSLFLIAISSYTLVSFFQSKTCKSRTILGAVTLALWGGAYALYATMKDPFLAQPSDFQQFNPFFVVALTPFSLAIFSALAAAGREPSAPKKIAYGMLVAALGFVVIAVASIGLTSPCDLGDSRQGILSPSWLIGTYLTLTFAELLLSPMGISFVSKVAPPKYKGLMMGCWFGATAIGNYLSSIPSMLWNRIPLIANWGILIALCLISAIVMFSIMKKVESAVK